MTVKDWLSRLKDPNEVGSFEYTMVYDFLQELQFEINTSQDERIQRRELSAALTDLEGWVTTLKNHFQTECAYTERGYESREVQSDSRL